ncbi:MAG: polysaccharide biosynthesis/export family protein [Pseudomonadota bacterium]
MQRARIPGVLALTALLLQACGSLPASGPSTDRILGKEREGAVPGIRVVDVTSQVNERLLRQRTQQLFSESFGQAAPAAGRIGKGDAIEISVWEAPPATLFGAGVVDARSSAPATSRVTVFPEQVVSEDGNITVPFAGSVRVAGLSLAQVESEIIQRLKGKANSPQVVARMLRNSTSNVTIVGDVATSTRMPLTPRGERVLDAVAAAGGVRQPVSKVTIQVTRGAQVQTLPLETIIRDPRQNVPLQPGDVVTAVFQPYSFTAFGATGKNEEIGFEGQGISLAQALARSGGLQDARSDAQGVFVFRYELPANVADGAGPAAPNADGRVPVIYRVDLKDPNSFFLVQSFPVSHRDVLYVSNAPAAELQKFLNLVFSVAFPALQLINATN